MRVWFHCDDFGMTPAVTERIAAAWEAGLLDGFSVMANGGALEVAAERLRRQPERAARIAVHLNLFEGPATAGREAVPDLTDARGLLNGSFGGLALRWLLAGGARRRCLLEQVEREWRRQIEIVRATVAPRAIAALDGHVHLHMLPFLFPSAVALAQEYDIGGIRVVHEPFHLSGRPADSFAAGFLLNFVKNAALRLCVPAARRALRGSGVQAMDAFIGVLYSGRMSRSAARSGLAQAERLGAESVEVLFHVGRAPAAEVLAWRGRGGSMAFVTSERRDREYAELAALRG